MNKSKRKSLVSKLDTLFSLAVRLRDKKIYGGMCAFSCGHPAECCFHFITRAKYATRWDFDNAVASCKGCNYRMEYDPGPFFNWYIQHKGSVHYNELVEKSHKISKRSNEELGELAESIKATMESAIK